jgi:hypothetical protein
MYFQHNNSAQLRLELLYSIKNTAVRRWPFEHFFGADCLPPSLVSGMHSHWPERQSLVSLADTKRASSKYKDRLVVSLGDLRQRLGALSPGGVFWEAFGDAVQDDDFMMSVADWLWPSISSIRALPKKIELFSDCVLTEDFEGYNLGPHTDAPHRLVTLLWFLPQSTLQAAAGTSLYVPNPGTPALEAPSASHYCRSNFQRVFTAPFSPGACLGFVISPNSFHGVEPQQGLAGSRRQIQYSIRFRAVD